MLAILTSHIFQLVDLRWWIINENSINKRDLSTIPPIKNIFKEAESVMLPNGMIAEEWVASIPLQNLFDHTAQRLLLCDDIKERLVDGQTYKFLIKTGSDGQTGRGNYSFKGKQINDDKW